MVLTRSERNAIAQNRQAIATAKQARAAAAASGAGSLDALPLGVLHVVASYGLAKELGRLRLVLGAGGGELTASGPLDAILLASRGGTVVRKCFERRPQPGGPRHGFQYRAGRESRYGEDSLYGLRLKKVETFSAALAALAEDVEAYDAARLEAAADDAGPGADVAARLAASVYHHGACDVTNTDSTADAIEILHCVSLAGAGGARVPFVVFRGSQNLCDKGCWCAGAEHIGLHVKVGDAFERLVTYAFTTGEAGGNSWYKQADRATSDRVAAVLGIGNDEVGYALRTVFFAANIQREGDKNWRSLTRLAGDGGDRDFFEDESWSDGGPPDAPGACRTFPYANVTLRPPPLGGDGPGMYGDLCESPRKLLDDAMTAIARRCAGASSLSATVKALHGWQAGLDDFRFDRAMTKARSEPYVKDSTPDEELWIDESACRPFEYDGPATASMSGGACVIA